MLTEIDIHVSFTTVNAGSDMNVNFYEKLPDIPGSMAPGLSGLLVF